MQLVKNTITIFLAMLLLVATTGVTLSKHYCMGRLKSIAVFEQAGTCYEGETTQMPCCEDVIQELKVKELAKTTFDFKFTPDLHTCTLATCLVLLHQATPSDVAGTVYVHYTPPLPDRDIPVLVQSFLI